MLARTAKGLAEGLTGLAASDNKDRMLSIGYLFQRVRSGKFLDTLKSQWDEYREKGRIKDDYIDTDQHAECLQEMLDFIDNDVPDSIRFEAMKQVFLNASSETISDRESVLPQQYMRLCRGLQSGEVLVLRTLYEVISEGGKIVGMPTSPDWNRWLASRSGLECGEHVSLFTASLKEKHLIVGEQAWSHKHGMTSLGLSLCEFISAPVDRSP